MTDMTKLEQAKARFCLTSVFFPLMVMSTLIEPDPAIPIMATDGISIWYNHDYVEKQDVDIVIALLAHEIIHIIKRHPARRGQRDPELWNIAADLEVNHELVISKFKLWDGALHDPQFADMSVETIYDILARDADKRPKQPDTAGADLREPAPRSPDQEARDEQSVRERVGFAATQAQLAGRMDANLERLVGELLTPVIPWEQVLMEFMQNFSTDNESWTRRNRRVVDLYLPGRHNETMGPLWVVVDTSGSISDDVFQRVFGELSYIADVLKPECIGVVWCDSAVRGEQMFEPGDEIKLTPRGGGGTDMRVGLAHVEQHEPQVVILFTDCYTPWGPEPDYSLLVLSTTEQVAPIGTTIHVKV